MDYFQYLNGAIEVGIAEARAEYDNPMELQGALDGFEACRGRTVPEIEVLLKVSQMAEKGVLKYRPPGWQAVYRWAQEIEWIWGAVSLLKLDANGQVILDQTGRALEQMAQSLGRIVTTARRGNNAPAE
jgi:hypothetical protein